MTTSAHVNFINRIFDLKNIKDIRGQVDNIDLAGDQEEQGLFFMICFAGA